MDEYLALATMSTRALTAYNVSEFVTSASTTDVISTSGNETASLGYVMGDQEKQRIIIIAVIMAFTIIGNMTLILVLLCKRSRRIKRVNILLLNLAFGDLAVAMFVNSTEILFIAFGDWALGPIMCKIVVYVQMICLSSATNLLTAMSIDRYQVIVKPMQSLARRPRIWLKIVIAWLLSLLLTLPQLFIFIQHEDGYKLDGTPRRKCSSKGYTASWQRKVNFTFTTTYILFVPMAIMLYCYVKIIRVVWIRAKSESYRRPSSFTPPPPPATTPTSSTPKTSSDSGGEVEVTQDGKTEMSDVSCGCVDRSKNSEKGNTNSSVRWARSVKDNKETDTNDNAPMYRERRPRMPDLNDDDLNPGSPRMSVRRSLVTASKRRALIMTLTVVISFLVCHTPYFFITFIRIYSDYKIQLSRALLVSEFMVMVHSTLNPLLYGLFTLRDYHLKYIIAVLTCSRRPTSPKGLRFRQYSEERHKLLNSVRSRLIHHNPTTGAATITTTSTNSNNKNSKNKKDRKKDHHHHQHHHHHKKAATIAATPTPYNPPSATSASASSTASTSILNRLRCQPLPYFTRKGRRKRQQQNALLFANKDAIHLTRQNRMRSEETDQTELESLPLTPKDLSPGALIANTHTITSNGSWPTMHNCWKPEVRHLSGSDLRGTTTLPNDSYDVSGGVNVIPWAPQDDEFMIGGLTRV